MDGMTLILFFPSPPFNAGPQKPQTLTAMKFFDQKFRFLMKK